MQDLLNSIEFRPAYTHDGKCSWPRKEFSNVPGVYVIRYRGEIAYVGRSGGRLYRSCYRHFGPWLKKHLTSYKNLVDKKKKRINPDIWYDRRFSEIWMHALEDKEESIIVEKALVAILKPTHNRRDWGLFDPPPPNKEFRDPAKEVYADDYDLIEEFEKLENYE